MHSIRPVISNYPTFYSYSAPPLEALAPLEPMAACSPVGGAGELPVDEANQFIQGERQEVQFEKYNFSPEEQQKVDTENQKRAVDNQKIMAEADRATDPKQREEILKKLSPPIDLAGTTAQIDAISQDSSLTGDQKKERIEQIKKDLKLSDNDGPVNMNDTFTGRLGKIDLASKDRIEKHAEQTKKQYAQALDQIGATYGKNSPEYVAMKAQADASESIYKQEAKRLDDEGGFLKDLYRPRSFWESIGGFFAGIGEALGKVVDLVMPLIKLIPGVGQIAGAVWAGVKTIGNLISGNVGGALQSLLGALPVVGDVVGNVAGTVINVGSEVAGVANGGIHAVSAAVRGDVAGVLSGAAEAAGGGGAGDVAQVLNTAATVTRSGESLMRGDLGGALSGVAQLAGVDPGQVAQDLLSNVDPSLAAQLFAGRTRMLR